MTYAGFLKRLVAAIVDGIIIFIPTILLGGGAGSIGLGLVLGVVYYGIFESSRLNGTPGKALLNMAVLTETGETLTFKAACIRYFCRYLSIATLYIGYVMQLFTKKRQTLHDMLSETVVIERQNPDINYFTVWLEQFKAVVNKI